MFGHVLSECTLKAGTACTAVPPGRLGDVVPGRRVVIAWPDFRTTKSTPLSHDTIPNCGARAIYVSNMTCNVIPVHAVCVYAYVALCGTSMKMQMREDTPG